MTIATELVYDATSANIAHLPAGLAAGYVTGTPDIAWTPADWAAHPGAVRIDQTPAESEWDATADVDDYENGAVTLAELAPRARERQAAFDLGTRPGQRRPAVYASRKSVTDVVNALIAGGIKSGVGLVIADWDNDLAAATAEVAGASGPFPVVGRQFRNAGLYDVSVFSAAWLGTVSGPRPAAPPGQWNDPRAWTWKQANVSGTGLDGRFHLFSLDAGTGKWEKLL